MKAVLWCGVWDFRVYGVIGDHSSKVFFGLWVAAKALDTGRFLKPPHPES